jgi:hypothetical protein
MIMPILEPSLWGKRRVLLPFCPSLYEVGSERYRNLPPGRYCRSSELQKVILILSTRGPFIAIAVCMNRLQEYGDGELEIPELHLETLEAFVAVHISTRFHSGHPSNPNGSVIASRDLDPGVQRRHTSGPELCILKM